MISNPRTLKLVEKRFSSEYGKRAFSCAGPKIWNSLPLDIRAEVETELFKKKLKSLLMTKSDELYRMVNMRWEEKVKRWMVLIGLFGLFSVQVVHVLNSHDDLFGLFCMLVVHAIIRCRPIRILTACRSSHTLTKLLNNGLFGQLQRAGRVRCHM